MRISHSALQTYLECPYKYFLHYLRKLRPIDEKSSLLFGAAIDTGLNHLLETRNLIEAKEQFLIHWDKYRYKKVQYSKADLEEHLVEDEPGNTWLSLRRRGLILLEEFDAQVMPRLKKIIAVQVNRTIKNDDDDELIVKCDFIAEWEDGIVTLFDNKTSTVKYAEDSVRNSEQLAIYYEQLKYEYNLERCGFIVIPKKINKKKLPRVDIKVILDNVSEETLDKTLASYDEVLYNIKAAQFEQNKSSCIGKFGRCPYYLYCHSGSLKGLKE